MNQHQSNKSLERKVNFLSAYAVISASIIGFFAFSGFSPSERIETFDELTVKKSQL